jgi:hypothetical protein
MHPDDIYLMAVNTLRACMNGLLRMRIKNAPAILNHQRRITAALQPWIGKICHVAQRSRQIEEMSSLRVSINDIIIWQDSLNEHSLNEHWHALLA